MKNKIDTREWKEFAIGDLFVKLTLRITNINFNKKIDLSDKQTEEFNLPVVNAKHCNNGIMFYGREKDFETAEMTLDIVQNGAIATGDVYAQPQKTGVLWDAYLVKPLADIKSKYTLLFFATTIEKTIKKHFGYNNKCVWEKASSLKVKLPSTDEGLPDFDYMDAYMSRIFEEEESFVDKLEEKDFSGNKIDTSKWKEFKIGQLFNIVKPPVLHDRQVYCSENGLPYVVRTKFNNGIKSIVTTNVKIEPSPAGVITWGAENASFFYQDKPFYSGRDIYYLETKKLDKNSCLFIISTMSKIAEKYQYNYGLFPDLLKNEIIRLPATDEGLPDFDYMDTYMQRIIDEEEAVADKITEE